MLKSSSTTTGSSYITYNQRNRAILIGDSLLANSYLPIAVNTTVGGFTVNSSGIATIDTTTAGNHFLIQGNKAQIYTVSATDNYQSSINGVTVTILSTPSLTTATFDTNFNGSKMAANDYSSYGWYVVAVSNGYEGSWYRYLNLYLKARFNTVANYSIGGTTSAVGITLLPKMLAGPYAENVFIQYGTNDINTTDGTVVGAMAGAATALTNITTIANAFVSKGSTVWIGTPPPISPTSSGNTSTTAKNKNLAMLQLRNGLLNLAKSNPKIVAVDVFADCINGTDANGDFISGYSGDGIHPYTTALVNIAKNEYPRIASSYMAEDSQPVTILDDSQTYTSTNAPNPNILPNGLMNGGTTTPTSWTIASNTGTTTFASQQARTAISGTNSSKWGYGWIANSTALTNGQGYTLQSGAFQSLFVTGQWYQAGFTVYAKADAVNIGLLTGYFFLGSLGGAYIYNQKVNNGIPIKTGDVLEYLSEPVYIPSTVNSAVLQINVSANGIATANFEFSSAFVRQVDNPYA